MAFWYFGKTQVLIPAQMATDHVPCGEFCNAYVPSYSHLEKGMIMPQELGEIIYVEAPFMKEPQHNKGEGAGLNHWKPGGKNHDGWQGPRGSQGGLTCRELVAGVK